MVDSRVPFAAQPAALFDSRPHPHLSTRTGGPMDVDAARPASPELYPTLFRQYIQHSTQAAVEVWPSAGPRLAAEQREQSLHTLEFALNLPAGPDRGASLLISLAPRLDQAGLRQDVALFIRRGRAVPGPGGRGRPGRAGGATGRAGADGRPHGAGAAALPGQRGPALLPWATATTRPATTGPTSTSCNSTPPARPGWCNRPWTWRRRRRARPPTASLCWAVVPSNAACGPRRWCFFSRR